MEMPDAVKWLLPIVVGESWPEGDETKLRALRDAWHTASSAIGPASDAGNQAAQGIHDNWTGDGADAFAEQWKKFVEGDDAYFKQLADATKALLERLLKQGLKKIGMEVLKNEAINLGMDAGIQGLQMAKGDRKSWDWSKTSDAAISGAVGGVVGAASGSIGRGATEGLSHSA